MASSDSIPQPKKNIAYRAIFPIFDGDGDLVPGATGLDSEVSKDCGTFTDCTNEATEIATSSGMYYLDLTSTEMNADSVAIIVKTSTAGAKTTPIVLYPEEAGDIRVDVTMVSGDATAADNLESAADGTGYNLGGGSVVAASVTAAVSANVTQIDGQATSGNNANLKLKSLSISNSAGNAVDFISTGSNGIGLNVAGNGSGGGIRAVGGSSGTGISGEGTTTGAGIVAYGGSTSGPGFYAAAQSGSASDGIVATALGSGNGFSAAAGGAGNAIKAVANSADAISVSVSTSNGNALSLTGRGTGAGIVSNGGATGKGIDANGSGGAADIEGNLTGNVTGSVGSVTGAVGSVTGLTASNLDATISSRMATYTQPTGFLATTFPSGTVANTTNITAGTITTVTNLTNAPTAGDLTATMKTSVTTAATAATPTAAAVTGAVGSVTGNVGGNVVGSVASVTAAVATTSNIKQNQALANFEFMMTDSTNHAPVTGKTVTCTRSIDGGAFGAGSLANVAEISNGMYRVDFAASDLNGKNIVLRATATSSDDTFERIVTQP